MPRSSLCYGTMTPPSTMNIQKPAPGSMEPVGRTLLKPPRIISGSWSSSNLMTLSYWNSDAQIRCGDSRLWSAVVTGRGCSEWKPIRFQPGTTG